MNGSSPGWWRFWAACKAIECGEWNEARAAANELASIVPSSIEARVLARLIEIRERTPDAPWLESLIAARRATKIPAEPAPRAEMSLEDLLERSSATGRLVFALYAHVLEGSWNTGKPRPPSPGSTTVVNQAVCTADLARSVLELLRSLSWVEEPWTSPIVKQRAREAALSFRTRIAHENPREFLLATLHPRFDAPLDKPLSTTDVNEFWATARVHEGHFSLETLFAQSKATRNIPRPGFEWLASTAFQDALLLLPEPFLPILMRFRCTHPTVRKALAPEVQLCARLGLRMTTVLHRLASAALLRETALALEDTASVEEANGIIERAGLLIRSDRQLGAYWPVGPLIIEYFDARAHNEWEFLERLVVPRE